MPAPFRSTHVGAGISPYATPTDAFRTSATLAYQAPATSLEPVYPAGSLGLEALDTPSNQIIATRTVTTNPLYKTAMKRDGSRLYTLTLRGNELLTINPRDGTLLNTASVVGTGLALSPDESHLYVAGQLTTDAAHLYVFDARTGADAGGVDFASTSYYYNLAISPDGTRIYILPLNVSPILVINAANLSQLPSIATPSPPNGQAVSPDGARLYVTTPQDSMLTIFSTATSAVLSQLPLDPTPKGVVFSPDGASAYVLTQDGSFFARITTVDVATSMPVGQFFFQALATATSSDLARRHLAVRRRQRQPWRRTGRDRLVGQIGRKPGGHSLGAGRSGHRGAATAAEESAVHPSGVDVRGNDCQSG